LQKYISYSVIIAFIILIQGTLFAQNTTPTSDASIVFEEEKYDFGEVSNDTLLSHVFKFENTGTDTLFIKGVRGS
jgi:hypothetical protein